MTIAFSCPPSSLTPHVIAAYLFHPFRSVLLPLVKSSSPLALVGALPLVVFSRPIFSHLAFNRLESVRVFINGLGIDWI